MTFGKYADCIVVSSLFNCILDTIWARAYHYTGTLCLFQCACVNRNIKSKTKPRKTNNRIILVVHEFRQRCRGAVVLHFFIYMCKIVTVCYFSQTEPIQFTLHEKSSLRDFRKKRKIIYVFFFIKQFSLSDSSFNTHSHLYLRIVNKH